MGFVALEIFLNIARQDLKIYEFRNFRQGFIFSGLYF
jgi:hypothetical protein